MGVTYAPTKAAAPSKGFIGTLGTGIFDLLDAPGNITRSGIRFGQIGDPALLLNILKNVVPFTEAERIAGEEITGGPISGLILEIVADPLMAVNSIGGLTKIGKSLKRIQGLRAARRVAIRNKNIGKSEVLRKAIEGEVANFKKLRPGKPGTVPKRSLVELGFPFSKSGIEVGTSKSIYKARIATYNKLRESFGPSVPWGMMPDVRKPNLLRRADRLRVKLYNANRADRTLAAAKITEDLGDIERKIAGLKPGLLPLRTAAWLRKRKRSLRTKFQHDPESAMMRAIQENVVVKEAEDLSDLGKLEKAMNEQFEAVRKAEGMEVNELLFRLTRAMESRKLVRGGALEAPIPKVDLKTLGEASKLKKSMGKKIDEISKIDDPVRQADELAEAWGKFTDNLSATRAEGDIRRLRMTELVETWGKLTTADLDLVYTWGDYLDELIKLEQASRINIHPLKADGLDYMRRMWTKEFMALKKKDKAKYTLMTNKAKVMMVSAMKRKLYPEREITEINKMMQELYGIKMFEENPIVALIERKRQHVIGIHKAQAALHIAEIWGKKGGRGKKLWAKGDDARSFGKKRSYLGKLGLTGEAVGKLSSVDESIRIPHDIVDMASRTDRILQRSVFNDENVLKFFRAVDHINAPYKVLVTSPFASFHNRNMVGNWFLNMLGGVYNPKYYLRANQLQHKMRLWKLDKYNPTRDELRLFNDIINYRIKGKSMWVDLFRGTRPTEEFLKKYIGYDVSRPLTGTVDNWLEKLGRPPKFGEDITAWKNPMMGRAYGEYIEDNARIAHFLAKRDAGLTQFEAMRSVNKYLFDYSKLTTFEQQIMRPTFLFYTWMRNALPLMIRTSLQNPRVAATYGKITNLGDDAAPDYLRARGTIPLPKWDMFLSGLGLPIEELHLTNVDDVDPLFFPQVKRLLDKVVSRMSPALRIPYEIATGKTAFSRRPLTSMSKKELSLHALPISRFYRTGERVLDPEQPMAFRMLDALSGAKFYPVSLTRAQLDELKRAAVGTGKFYRSGFLTPAKLEFRDDAEVKRIKEQMSVLRKRLDQERKRRR